MSNPSTPPLQISAVERETGLSKEVLRKWESRYGFPTPLRDSQGERAYPPEQVQRLRLIKRLMDTGIRPSRLVGESEANLNSLARDRHGASAPSARDTAEGMILGMLGQEDPSSLRRHLYRELMSQGIERFVQDTLTPLSYSVGEAWARGEIGIHEEHLYSETVQGLLRDAIANLADSGGSPRVLLTTLPGEQHGLGVLMVAAMLAQRGACCICLGTQTPVRDIVMASRAHDVQVVALSFSAAYPQRKILPALAELHQCLDEATEVWAGGAGCARLAAPAAGVYLVPTMDLTLATLAAWQAKHPVRASAGGYSECKKTGESTPPP
jgi:methylmalonyl-CoA mutase cobalamin-binding subunit